MANINCTYTCHILVISLVQWFLYLNLNDVQGLVHYLKDCRVQVLFIMYVWAGSHILLYKILPCSDTHISSQFV